MHLVHEITHIRNQLHLFCSKCLNGVKVGILFLEVVGVSNVGMPCVDKVFALVTLTKYAGKVFVKPLGKQRTARPRTPPKVGYIAGA